MMPKIFAIAIVALAMIRVAHAQTTGDGTVVFGTGAYSNGFSSGPVMQFGGGGEAVSDHRIGVGGDVLVAAARSAGWVERR
jgi:hypothetical protein